MRKKFLVVLMLSVLGCTKETMPTAVGPTQPTATVSITPSSPTVSACGGTQQFSAVYTGMTDGGTNWSVQEPGGGTITVSGLYSAPCTVGTYHVRAASAASPQVTATATVTVGQSFTITVSPATAAVNSCLTQQFTASYSGTSDTRTTWSVQEGAAGGSVTTSGLYTAPNAAGTYHVVGTSVLDPLRTSVATVTVTDKVLSVAVSPPTVTLLPNGTQQFTATVTTTCGSGVATVQNFTSPAGKQMQLETEVMTIGQKTKTTTLLFEITGGTKKLIASTVK